MSDCKTPNEAVIKGDIHTAVTETQKALDVCQTGKGALVKDERVSGRSEDLAQE